MSLEAFRNSKLRVLLDVFFVHQRWLSDTSPKSDRGNHGKAGNLAAARWRIRSSEQIAAHRWLQPTESVSLKPNWNDQGSGQNHEDWKKKWRRHKMVVRCWWDADEMLMRRWPLLYHVTYERIPQRSVTFLRVMQPHMFRPPNCQSFRSWPRWKSFEGYMINL